MNKIKAKLQNNIFLLDGSMGTYYASKTDTVGRGCEYANLSEPEVISAIHSEYIKAGADAIKTNTFAINRINMQGDDELCRKLIDAGYRIAKEAAGENIPVICDIGPVPVVNETISPADEYIWIADRFLSLGADSFIFETLENYDAPRKAAAHIKAQNPKTRMLLLSSLLPLWQTDLQETEFLLRIL